GKSLLLLLERLDPDRERLLVLLELLLQPFAVVLAHEQHADALVDRRLPREFIEFFEGPLDLAQLGLELHALAREDLELVLQLLVLCDLVLQLRRDVLDEVTSLRTRAETSTPRS